MHTLDEALIVVHIQEDLKSLTKDKAKKVLSSLKTPTDKSLEQAYKVLPTDKSIKDINTYTSRKEPEFQKEYKRHLKNTSGMHPENKEIYAVSMATASQLRRSASSDSKVSQAVDRFILKLHLFFKKYGRAVLTSGIVIQLISLFSTHVWGIVMSMPQLIPLFKLSLAAGPYAPWIILAGVLMLIIGYLLSIWYDRRKSEKQYKSGATNPYEV
jgi:hypothetical protein